MTEESHVLVIFPHPDDESFSSADTSTLYRQWHPSYLRMLDIRTNGA